MSAQLENGYTKLANELIEALAKIRISGEEMQCFWVIVRQTYGYNTKEKEISLSQFVLITGLKKVPVCKALSKLLQKNLITKKGNDTGNIYSIQKDFTKWTPLPKKVMTITKKGNVTKKGNELLPKKVMTVTNIGNDGVLKTATNKGIENPKESIKEKEKEKLIELKQKAPVKEFIDNWYKVFKNKFNKPYLVNGGKEGNLIKKLIDVYGYDSVKSFANAFWKSEDKWIKNSGYTIGTFYSCINKLITEAKKYDDKQEFLDYIIRGIESKEGFKNEPN